MKVTLTFDLSDPIERLNFEVAMNLEAMGCYLVNFYGAIARNTKDKQFDSIINEIRHHSAHDRICDLMAFHNNLEPHNHNPCNVDNVVPIKTPKKLRAKKGDDKK